MCIGTVWKGDSLWGCVAVRRNRQAEEEKEEERERPFHAVDGHQYIAKWMVLCVRVCVCLLKNMA